MTVTGGKLTTYRKMAEDAVDAAVAGSPFLAGASECRTTQLPLIGAAAPVELARVEAPRRVVDRFGTEAPAVVAAAEGDPSLLGAGRPELDVIGAEILYALRHEGALDVDDVLDRRTRIGLVPRDRDAAVPVVRSLLADGAGTPPRPASALSDASGAGRRTCARVTSLCRRRSRATADHEVLRTSCSRRWEPFDARRPVRGRARP